MSHNDKFKKRRHLDDIDNLMITPSISSFEPEYSECDEVALCMREEAFRRDLVEFITAAVGSRPKLMPREYRFVIYL